MRTLHGQAKPSKIFSAIDNQLTLTCNSIQPDGKATLKENRNSHAIVTSAYDPPKTALKYISQTFTTSINHDRALPTQRPTMGGKTISAIRRPIDTPMSNQDLLLLSRRIDPHEPLSSPHASPSKPPLPKKRNRSAEVPIVVKKKARVDDAAVAQFVCEPCNKKYKTRNGYTYHVERCKARPKKVVIHCICPEEEMKGTMIECTQCNTWLHSKCVDIADEASFRCPRCIPLCHDEPEDWQSNSQWEDEFTQHILSDWPATDPSSLMFSDNLLDDFSSDLVLSPTLAQSDWLHFANFEQDFQDTV